MAPRVFRTPYSNFKILSTWIKRISFLTSAINWTRAWKSFLNRSSNSAWPLSPTALKKDQEVMNLVSWITNKRELHILRRGRLWERNFLNTTSARVCTSVILAGKHDSRLVILLRSGGKLEVL